jgi:hypothetical protein
MMHDAISKKWRSLCVYSEARSAGFYAPGLSFTSYLTSANPAVSQVQGAEHSQKVKDILYANCKPEGFDRDYRAFGLHYLDSSSRGTVGIHCEFSMMV